MSTRLSSVRQRRNEPAPPDPLSLTNLFIGRPSTALYTASPSAARMQSVSAFERRDITSSPRVASVRNRSAREAAGSGGGVGVAVGVAVGVGVGVGSGA